jgi:hypothetical protein
MNSRFRGNDSHLTHCLFRFRRSKTKSAVKDFLEAGNGRMRLKGDTQRQASSQETEGIRRENEQLKQLVAELVLRNRVLKKRCSGRSKRGCQESQGRSPTSPTYPKNSQPFWMNMKCALFMVRLSIPRPRVRLSVGIAHSRMSLTYGQISITAQDCVSGG